MPKLRVVRRLMPPFGPAAWAVAAAILLSTPASAADCLGNVTRDFEDGQLAPLLTTSADPGCGAGTVQATGGALVVSRPAGIGTNCANGASLAPAYQLCGDFDIQVDFDLVTFGAPPSGRTRYATLYAWNQSGGGYLGIERQITSAGLGCRPFPDMYKTFFNTTDDCASSFVSTSQAQGRFRITRTGATWQASYWNGTAWVVTRTETGAIGPVGFTMYAGGDSPDVQDVHFDDLAVTSATCTGALTDDFDDGALAPLWADASTASCGTIAESGGVLNVSKPAGCVGFAIARLAGTRMLCGDFDLAVDYTLSMPPAQDAGGSIHGMQLRVLRTDALVAGAERYRQGSTSCVAPQSDSYKFYGPSPFCPPDADYRPTADTHGRLRLRRTGSTIEGYYLDTAANQWVLGMSRPITTEPLYVQLQTGTNGSLTAATSGTFDHLTVDGAAGLAPVLWLEGDAGRTPGPGGIATWLDQSGHGHHALQPEAVRQPAVSGAALNGHDALSFDGADDFLGFTGTSSMNEVTMAVVVRLQAGATGNAYYPLLLGGDPNITGRYYGIEARNAFSGSSADVMDIFGGFSNDARATSTGISAFGQWRILVIRTAHTMGTTTVRVNGADAAMSLTGSDVPIDLTLGNANGTGFGGVGGTSHIAPGYAKCDVAEVLVYDRALSDAEQGQVESYLSAKYDVRLFPQVALCETFGDGTLTAPRWLLASNACGTPVATGGELRLAESDGCSNGYMDARLDPARHEIHGDFDITVDYRLPDFDVPNPGDRVAGLRLLDLSNGYYATLERYNRVPGACNPSDQNYKGWFQVSDNCDGAVVWAPTTDTQGRLRITRQGSRVTEYTWNAGWIPLAVADLPVVDVQVVLFAATLNGDTGHDVRFDNLCVDANLVTAVPAPSHDAGLSAVLAPNPVRGRGTTLDFQLPVRAATRVEVFDVGGRRVARLLDADLAAGHHRVEWSPDGRAAGVYEIRLAAGAARLARRVLVIR